MLLRKLSYLFLLVLFFVACKAPQQLLKDFTSDGCSGFPDKSLAGHQDWSECCLEHDILYWQGGTEKQRLIADSLLKECVLQKTGNEKLAELMYKGVRFGGNPNFPTWYRWGYGWNFIREYKPISAAEQKLIDEKLKIYYQNKPGTNK